MGINPISGTNLYGSMQYGSYLMVRSGNGLMGIQCSSEEEALRKSREHPGKTFLYNGHAYRNGKMIS